MRLKDRDTPMFEGKKGSYRDKTPGGGKKIRKPLVIDRDGVGNSVQFGHIRQGTHFGGRGGELDRMRKYSFKNRYFEKRGEDVPKVRE